MDPTQAPLVGPVAPPPPVPPDVQAMERLLHSCGVHRYEPAVVQQLLEIAQHYSRSIVQEAADVKAYTGGSKVRNMHVQLGIASVRSLAFRTNIPSTAQLAAEARERNRDPLPLALNPVGVTLPGAEVLSAPLTRINPEPPHSHSSHPSQHSSHSSHSSSHRGPAHSATASSGAHGTASGMGPLRR